MTTIEASLILAMLVLAVALVAAFATIRDLGRRLGDLDSNLCDTNRQISRGATFTVNHGYDTVSVKDAVQLLAGHLEVEFVAIPENPHPFALKKIAKKPA